MVHLSGSLKVAVGQVSFQPSVLEGVFFFFPPATQVMLLNFSSEDLVIYASCLVIIP
jgi:hypothetical protein